jgi:fatty acid desaturase
LTLPAKDLHQCLRYAEPVIAIATFIMVYFYWAKKSLAMILLGLGATVTWLWISKLIEAPSWIGSGVVGVLGFCVFVVAIIQLNQHQGKGHDYQRRYESSSRGGGW